MPGLRKIVTHADLSGRYAKHASRDFWCGYGFPEPCRIYLKTTRTYHVDGLGQLLGCASDGTYYARVRRTPLIDRHW